MSVQKQRPEVFYEKGGLKSFAIFTENARVSFLITLQPEETLVQVLKETLVQVFSC